MPFINVVFCFVFFLADKVTVTKGKHLTAPHMKENM